MNVACNECESGSPCLNVRHPNDLGACLAASAHCNQSFVLLRDDDRHREFLMDLQESSGTFGNLIPVPVRFVDAKASPVLTPVSFSHW